MLKTLETYELDISMRDEIRKRAAGIGISYYNFTNMFMWRKTLNYRVLETDGCICIIGRYRNYPPFMLFPLGRDVISAIKTVQSEMGPITMSHISEEMALIIKENFPSAVITDNPDFRDYIYLASDLDKLAGRKFHQKRNHIAKFHSRYEFEYVSVTKNDTSNLPLLRQAAEELFTDRENDELLDEHEAILEVLNNFKELGVTAALIRVDGQNVAYTIGEMMSDDTALIHIEKADRSFEGSYSVINREFVHREFADKATYVNREEDLGIEGLRKAKLSYNPISMPLSYSVKIK